MAKIIPIKSELRPILDEFLSSEDYKDIFIHFAKSMGYQGNDMKVVRPLLFMSDKQGNIRFNIQGMYDLFLEFQILKQIRDKEPYKSLLETYPIAIQNVRVLAKKMLYNEKISQDDLEIVFNPATYEKTSEGDKPVE
jgi:hypothetical protein